MHSDCCSSATCARRISIMSTPRTPSMRLRTQQLMIEFTDILDRPLQLLIIVEPTANLGDALATHAELLRAPAGVGQVTLRDFTGGRWGVGIYPQNRQRSRCCSRQTPRPSRSTPRKAGKLSRGFQDCEQIGSFEKSGVRAALGTPQGPKPQASRVPGRPPRP